MIWNKDNCDRYLHTSSKSINEKTNTNAISQTGGSRKISSAFMNPTLSAVKDINSQDKKRMLIRKTNKGNNFLGLQNRSITGKGLSVQKMKKKNSVLSEVDETKRSFKSDENSHRGIKKTFIKQTGIPPYLNCSSRKKKVKFSLRYKAKSIIMSPQTRPRDINQLKKQGTLTIQLFTGADDIQH